MKIEQSELIRMIKESIIELSNQTIGSAVKAAGEQRREVQRDSIIIKKLNEVNFANSFRIQLDGNYFTFKMEFSNDFDMFVIQVHVNRPSGFYLCNLMPEHIHTTPRGEDITETEVGYVIDNLKAGYRAKLQNMRREAIELNQSMKEENINESLGELSNQTIGSYMRATQNQRRDRQFRTGKWHAIDTINKKYRFTVTLDNGEEVSFSLGFDNGEFFIFADVEENTSYNKEPYTYKLMPSNPRRMLDGSPITETEVGYAIDNLRAGERMKLKGLCQAAIELNQGFNDEKMVAESVDEKAVSKTQHIVTVNKPILRKIIKETIINYLNLK